MFKKSITPKLTDLNGARHIGYDVICGWLQLGFVDFLLMFGESPGTEPQLAMINLETEFLGEVFFGKDVEIITRVARLGHSSFVLHHEMVQNEKRCVRAATTFVCYDYNKKKSREIPKSVSKKIRKHLTEDEIMQTNDAENKNSQKK